jgi:hypothetical protein
VHSVGYRQSPRARSRGAGAFVFLQLETHRKPPNLTRGGREFSSLVPRPKPAARFVRPPRLAGGRSPPGAGEDSYLDPEAIAQSHLHVVQQVPGHGRWVMTLGRAVSEVAALLRAPQRGSSRRRLICRTTPPLGRQLQARCAIAHSRSWHLKTTKLAGSFSLEFSLVHA